MPLIQVRGLTKLYRMGESVVRALDGVDLDVKRGEYVAITGPSGSGKSTLMHLIGCLDRPTSGHCYLDGRDMGRASDREQAAVRNKQIGFVFQTFNLINRTSALDNVGVSLFYARKGNTRGPARRALERVELAHRAKHRPNELSGGERQRVAIARALVNDPLLLLADEPTGNLDTRTGAQIMTLFRELNEQGVTIILVTHEHDVATQTRRIVQMRDGRVISDRATKEVLPELAPPGAGRAAPITAPAGPATDAPATAVPVAPDSVTPSEVASTEPPRTAAGAVGALACGIVAAGLGLLWWVGGTIASKVFPYDPSSKAMPPQPLVFLGLAVVLGMLAAIVLGIISVAWGARVRKRIRNEPVELAGRRHASVAIVLGVLAIVAPCALSLLGRLVT